MHTENYPGWHLKTIHRFAGYFVPVPVKNKSRKKSIQSYVHKSWVHEIIVLANAEILQLIVLSNSIAIET